MNTPKLPSISIVLMTLVPVITIIGAAIIAPCIEIGIFWVAVATALAVSIYAWRNGDNIGQSTMLLIYFLLACSIVLAVTSVVDIANYSMLGDKYDSETGVLLGGLIAYGTIFCIASRSSKRFPSSLSWGALLAFLMSYGYGSFYGKAILPEYLPFITVASLLIGMAAFISLSICKNNLTDNQYLSVISIVVVLLSFSSPSTKDNFVAGFTSSVLMFLAGLLFFVERRSESAITRVAGIMLLYMGFTSVVQDALFRGIGMNEIVAGIPSIFCSLIIIVWIRFRKTEFPRGLYWVSLLIFGVSGITSVVPESHSEALTLPLFNAMLLFVVTCVWYASAPAKSFITSWRVRFRYGYVTCCFLIALVISAWWFMRCTNALVKNNGVAHLVSQLNGSMLWPGDTVFVRLAMMEESLWPENIGHTESETLNLNRYLKTIRPSGDRFSGIVDTKTDQADDLGIDSEGIGIHWVTDKDSLKLMKVNSSSPAGKAGLVRGDRIITINGKPVKDIKNNAAWYKLFGEWKAGTRVSLNVLNRSGIKRSVSISVGVNAQDPANSRVIVTANGYKVGYLYLESFNSAQFNDIKSHFAAFKREGVRDLVLDLRYNGGGVMARASTLASLIAGQELEGKTFIRWEYSPKNEDRDSEYKFKRLSESVQTRRLVVLTTDETCSASETIISGLRPYIPVYTVGSTTCGKPYGMDGIEFGAKTLYPVTARVVNSRGEGYYTNGIRADFKTKDDLSHQLGDPKEGMLKKALEVLKKEAIHM